MSQPDPMGPVIATRTMSWQNADGARIPAIVEIGLPFEQNGWWWCQLRTTGLGPDQLIAMAGTDAISALCAALETAGTFVSISPMAAGLDWAVFPNWGFPVMPTPDNGEDAEAPQP